MAGPWGREPRQAYARILARLLPLADRGPSPAAVGALRDLLERGDDQALEDAFLAANGLLPVGWWAGRRGPWIGVWREP